MTKSQEHRGLSDIEVSQRIAQGQLNTQKVATDRSVRNIFADNIFTSFNGVVGGAFGLLLILGQWQDALFGFVVLINMGIGITQELVAKNALDNLKILTANNSIVIRGGKRQSIPVAEVVLDDVIVLQAGDVVPADSRVLDPQLLEVDESLLTGESDPISKAENQLLLAGSLVVAGTSIAQVIRVGADTFSGSLASAVKRYQLVHSELRSSINRVVKWVSFSLVPVVLISLIGQIQANPNLIDAIVSAVAGVISMIPQGLVLITSIAFAVAATRLARNKVLLKELAAVEVLARVDVVCFDKTGTLTRGSIQHDSVIELHPAKSPSLDWCEVLGHFAQDEMANATTASLKEHFSPSKNLVETSRIPFSSVRKWSAFVLQEGSNSKESWILGAPEFILSSQPTHEGILKQAEDLAAGGKRTLLLASSKLGISNEQLPSEMTPVLLITFSEEVRSESRKTLEYFRSQGVAVHILSGDSPRTVSAVARQAGLETKGEGFDAAYLPENPRELAALLQSENIFGRVTPQQKQLIVQTLQSQGRTVAMFGDGINDSLALKQADLGVAMGSAVASTKAIANLILVDNNFDRLPGVVSEGRRVIANIERTSRLFLTKTVWAFGLTLIYGLLFLPFPFLPRQISLIDSFIIGIPAFLVALLPNTELSTTGFIRRTLRFSIPAGGSVLMAILLLVVISGDSLSFSEIESQTAVCLLLAITGLWVLATAIRPVNPVKSGILILMVLIAFAGFTTSSVMEFFNLTQLDALGYLLVISCSALGVVGIELSHKYSKN
jgi:cation-transporting ATPase E